MNRLLERLALPGILVLALALRLVGIDFGLDLSDAKRTNVAIHLDERGMVEAVQKGLLRGSLHPGKFVFRGPAGFLVFGGVDVALTGVCALQHPRGWDGRVADLDANPSWLHLVHRCISAAAGVASVFVLARMLRREFEPRTGLLAGLFLATAYLHVRDSHFGTVDALFSLTILLALDAMLRWIRAPSGRRAWFSGFLAGVSTATKYFSVLLGLHLFVAHFFARKNAPGSSHRWLLWALLATPVGFFLLSPGLFVAGKDFLSAMEWTTENYSNEGSAGSLLESARWYATYSLAIGLGEPVLLLALWGLVVSWKRGASGRFFVLAVVLFLPSLFLTSGKPVRYGIPVLTLLAGHAGLGANALLSRFKPAVGAALVALCVVPSLARAVSLDALLTQTDTRTEMLDVLATRGVPAQEVLAIGWHFGLPIPVRRPARPYVIYGPELGNRKSLTLADVRARPPRLILWDLTAPEAVVPERAALEEFLREHYREVLRLDGRRGATELPYPISPPLMIPYAQPWEMSRPGSALVLYERVAGD